MDDDDVSRASERMEAMSCTRKFAEWELEELQQNIERVLVQNKNIMSTKANYLQ